MSAQRKPAPKSTSAARTRAYRERMRAKGLKPVTIWTFDTSDADFLRRVREASIAASRDPDELAVMEEIEAFQADFGSLD